MGTSILLPQDCLRDRIRHQTLAFSPPGSPHPYRSRYRKRSPTQASPMVAKSPAPNLVMGQVKILKRGEACDFGAGEGNQKARKGKAKMKAEKRNQEVDLALGSTDRLGPEPETLQRQIKASDTRIVGGVYAGSAVFTSPPPSSLPVPGFLHSG